MYKIFKKLNYLFISVIICAVMINISLLANSQICNSDYREPLVKIKETDDGLEIKSLLYGKVNLNKKFTNEKAIIEIISHPYIKRLFSINQYGLSVYGSHKNILFNNEYNIESYSRGDHSINMAVILCHHQRSLKEIISAILHDATHTKFSHLGDALIRNILCNKQLNNDPIISEMSKFIVNEKNVTAIQDMIFEWFFDKTGITEILKKYDIEVKDILIENNPVVKQKAPNICADNLEYTLTGCFLSGDITKEDVDKIIESLTIDEKGNWTFNENDLDLATNFGATAMLFDLKNAASYWCQLVNYYGAILLEKIIEKKVITIEDLIFAPKVTDTAIWEKIKKYSYKDSEINDLLERIEKPDKYFYKNNNENIENKFVCVKPKLRFLDPFIKNQGYLTKTNNDFNEIFSYYFEKYTKCGWSDIVISDDKFNLPEHIDGY